MFSGSELGISLEEILSIIENSASLGHSQDGDKFEITALRLTDATRQFHNGHMELHAPSST
jgi:hypothetical protein